MSMTGIFAALVMAQAAPAAANVGYDTLVQGEADRAIEQIAASDLDVEDPARLINLGVAHAMAGDREQARSLFERAATSRERYDLETATGQWIESRRLALKALAALDRGTLGAEIRTASR